MKDAVDLLNEVFQNEKKKKKNSYRSIERDEKYVNGSRREKIWMRILFFFFFANLNHVTFVESQEF